MKVTASIVCIGNWNPRIFTPSWVAENVYSIPNGQTMQVGLDEAQLTLNYGWNGLNFSVSDSKLEISTNSADNEKLGELDAIFKALLTKLPHTPIAVFGYNMNCTLGEDEVKLNRAFQRMKAQEGIGECKLQSQTYVSMTYGAKRSFILKNIPSGGQIACNFQFDDVNKMPDVGTVFDLIKEDYKHFFGYEL